MLLVSAVLTAFSIDGPNLATTDLDDLMDTPVAALRDILLFRRQPYLASVLPMYAFFALLVPMILPLARSKPWLLLAGSVALWAGAPAIDAYLPAAPDMHWDFNPFAWQLLFVLGVLARCQPVYQRVSAHRLGWVVSVLAFAVVAAAAYYKLFIEHEPLDGSLKQNLSYLRAVNFLAIAWLVANLIQLGWAKKARAMAAVGRRDRAQGLAVLYRRRGDFAGGRLRAVCGDRRLSELSARTARGCDRGRRAVRRRAGRRSRSSASSDARLARGLRTSP